ncbi:MAG: hypothetical protein ACIAQZ_07550 [Sedimentisphaeraceae bacterium JB056]
MNGWETSSYIYLVIMILFNILLTVIVSIGGYFDLKYLFKSLREEIVDETDDGRVKKENYEVSE